MAFEEASIKGSDSQILDSILTLCSQNEVKFRNLEQDGSGMFKDIISTLLTLDSP